MVRESTFWVVETVAHRRDGRAARKMFVSRIVGCKTDYVVMLVRTDSGREYFAQVIL